MFVLLVESMFRTRLQGINRRPGGTQDQINNLQIVLDFISKDVVALDLSHISGVPLVIFLNVNHL